MNCLRRSLLCLGMAICSTLLLVPATVEAQTLGEIQGYVTDDSGGALPGVTVTVSNTETGAERIAVTDARGFYNARALPAGIYDVGGSLEGFDPVEVEGIRLRLAQVLDVNFQMGLEAVSEAITVTSETPLIEVSRSTAAAYVGEQEIENLPISGRDFKEFALLTPTVQDDPIRGFVTMSGQRGIYTGLNVDGTSGKSAFFAYGRGGEATENDGLVVAQDSVREFQVITNGFAPEYGANGGGYINVVTKSGTNTWRGSAFYFTRDDSLTEDIPSSPLDASRGIDGSRPVDEFSRDNYGFSLGGPIQQDKLHFFFAYDQTDRNQPFTDTLSTRGAYDAILLRAATEPAFAALVEGYVPNNDGVAAPDPINGRTATGLFVRSVDNQILFGKLDYQVGTSHTLSLQNNFTDYTRTSTFKDEESLKTEDTNSLVGSFVSVLGSSSVNEFRIQVASDNLDRLSQRVGEPIEAEIRFQFGSRDSVGKFDFLPILVEEEKLQIQDNFSYLFGQHDLKFGVDYQSDSLAQLFAGSLDGRYDYSSMEAFLNNEATAVRFYFGDVTFPNYDETQDLLGVYAQDSWRKSETLTLNYGLRYGATYNPSNLEHIFPEGRNIADDTDNWAPRFGFAYSPGGDGQDVFRGGIGLFYGRTPTLLFASQVQENGLFPNYGRVTVGPGDVGFVPLGSPVDNENPPRETIPSTSFIDPNFEDSETWRLNLGYERQIAAGWSAGVDVIYAEGDKLQSNFDDQAVFAGNDAAGRPTYTGSRANPALNTIFVRRSIGESEYKAVTFKVNKRWSGRYQLQAHYTWSEDEDTDSNERSATSVTVSNTTNPNYDFGPSERNVENRLLVSGIVELPWGFRVSGIAEYRSGTPYTALDPGFNVSNCPNFNCPAARAVIGGQVVGRNSFENESITRLDLRLAKRFNFNAYGLELFGEVFNLFDDNSFAVVGSQQNPFNSDGSANSEFGIPDAQVNDQRQFQLGARVTFN